MYFDLKYLFIPFLAPSSPPIVFIITFPKYFKVKIKIANAKINNKSLFAFSKKVWIIGSVIVSIMFGIFNTEIFSENPDAKNKAVLEKNLSELSKIKTIITKIAL